MSRAQRLFRALKATIMRPKVKLHMRGLSQDEKDRIADAFKLYDANMDGHIDLEEFQNVFEHYLGRLPTKLQLDNFFPGNSTRNGLISYTEFEIMMAMRLAQKEAYHKLLAKYDKDGDGMITKTELLEVLNSVDFMKLHESRVPEEDVEDIIRLLDIDGNSVVNFADFLELLV